MKVKITGQFTNGQPYYAVIPKENLTDSEAQSLIDSESWKDNSSTSDGSPLDAATLQAELFDDFEYPSVKKAALRESLYESNDLSTVEAAINAADGVVKIWWEDMQYITLENPKTLMIQTALGWSESKVKGIFRRANEIQIANQ